ncbi:MAG: serine hydrolase [Proteobacteria bacterium]|nr:serine hydrolase [Pseudomonadota bacterium]MDA1311490.1 serine hydrolase [Pseudomonadota bacterium]
MMTDFPARPENQVTLANWRTEPFNKWAFHHVREIVASAEIANDPDKVAPLAETPEDLSGLTVADDAGKALDLAGFLAATDTDGLVILKSGRIIHESYANGMSAGSPHILMSVSKSMLGLLFGILAQRGVLDPDRLVTDIIPEVADTAYAGATLRHLLDMRAGIDFDEDYLATSGTIVQYRKATNWNPLELGEAPSDLRSFYANLTERDGPHGRSFHYVSPNTDLLGWAIERAAGARYADLLSELLWQPMGASRPAYITVDRFGAPRVAGGMCATVRDLARVGQLVIQDGARDGKQIVPAAWIADIAGNGDAAAWKAGGFAPYFPGIDIHYRSKWYIERSASATEGPMLFGVGVHGQNLFVDAKRDLVIAKVSSQAQPLDAAKISLTSRWVAAVRAGI